MGGEVLFPQSRGEFGDTVGRMFGDTPQDIEQAGAGIDTVQAAGDDQALDDAGIPGPHAIGLDGIPIRKGPTYPVVVSDLIRHRPIWFGRQDRSEASVDEFD